MSNCTFITRTDYIVTTDQAKPRVTNNLNNHLTHEYLFATDYICIGQKGILLQKHAEFNSVQF